MTKDMGNVEWIEKMKRKAKALAMEIAEEKNKTYIIEWLWGIWISVWSVYFMRVREIWANDNSYSFRRLFQKCKQVVSCNENIYDNLALF